MPESKPRCLQLFEASIKSPKTLTQYNTCLRKFLDWSKKDYQSFLLLPSVQIQTLLEDYVFYLRKRLGYSGINIFLSMMDKFLKVNDREYKPNKLRMLLPEKKKTEGKQAYTTEQIRKMLEFADTLRNKAIIHFLASSGVRAGVFEEMKWKHISEISDNCYCVVVYPNSTHEYVTFLHSESRKALDDYTEERKKHGELITPESYVFSSRKRSVSEKEKPISSQSVGTTLVRVLKRANILRVKAENGKRFDISTSNGFRKRFNTVLKSNPNISFAIAERMMDHKTYLESVYLDTSDKIKFFEEYKKAIPDLIISDSECLRLENEEKTRTIQKMESEKDERISKLEKKLETVLKMLDSVKID